jgi:hypothetical protein
MQFDAQKFETLSGLELANYAVRLMQESIAEADFLPYFQQKAGAMDPPHLEMAVGMLGKIGSDTAFRTVARYLEHPEFNVRFVATKTIAHMQAADEVIMRCVVESLRRHAGDPPPWHRSCARFSIALRTTKRGRLSPHIARNLTFPRSVRLLVNLVAHPKHGACGSQRTRRNEEIRTTLRLGGRPAPHTCLHDEVAHREPACN